VAAKLRLRRELLTHGIASYTSALPTILFPRAGIWTGMRWFSACADISILH
jgi:hypothetical protein